jgi:hypothetical protein
VTSFVIDCVRSPSTAAMRAAGVVGLTRYLSWTNRDSLGKVIHQAEFDRLIGDGFGLALNWEYAANDWLGGAAAGLAHGKEAVRQARALGYPAGCAIYGSADLDMTLAQWNGAGKAYAREYSATVRGAGYRPGPYGPSDVLTWCRDAGYADVYWQAGMSTAWSGHRNASAWPGANLRQRRQVYVGGVDCDYNDILTGDWGQHQRGHTPTGAKTMTTMDELNAEMTEVESGAVNKRNALIWWVRALADQDDKLIADTSISFGRPPFPGLTQIAAALTAVAMDAKAAAHLAPVALTDEQAKAFTDQITAQVQAGLEAIGKKFDDRFAKLEAAAAAALEAMSAVLAPPKAP